MGRLALRVGQNQHAGEPFDSLQGDGALPFEFVAAAVAPRHRFGVAGFGPGETPLGAGGSFVPVLGGAPDFQVDALQRLGQRQFDMIGDALDLRLAFRPTRSRNDVSAFSLSQAVASARAATEGNSSGATAGLRLPRTSGSRRPGSPSSVISTARSRSWMT